jgi:hypothetical protein
MVMLPGEAGHGHNGCTNDRIGPVRRAKPAASHRFLGLELNSRFRVILQPPRTQLFQRLPVYRIISRFSSIPRSLAGVLPSGRR